MVTQLSLTPKNKKLYIQLIEYLDSRFDTPNNKILLPKEIICLASLDELKDKIAKHLNIERPIIIGISDMTDDIGGEFSEIDEYIWVKIDSRLSENMNVAAGVLSHEMMHYVLRRNSVEFLDINLNEILTDIAAVYFGLGLVVLAGLYEKKITYGFGQISTQVHNYGYLDKESFLYVQSVIAKRHSNQALNEFIYSNSEQNEQLKKDLQRTISTID